MNVVGRVNINAMCNTVKLNRMFLHSSITLKVQAYKNEPVVLSQKVIKRKQLRVHGNGISERMLQVLKSQHWACYHVSVRQGFLPSLKKKKKSHLVLC